MSLLKPVRVTMENGSSFTGVISLSQDTSIVLSGDGVPTITPNYTGQGYLDRTGAQFYVANNLGQWEPLTFMAEDPLDINLEDLGDVNLVGLSNNQVLAYNSSNQTWFNYTLPSSSGFSPTIVTPQSGQAITFNGSNWINDDISFFNLKQVNDESFYLSVRDSNPGNISPGAYGVRVPYVLRAGSNLSVVDLELDISFLRGVNINPAWQDGQVLKVAPYTPPGVVPPGYTPYTTTDPRAITNDFLNLNELGDVTLNNPTNGQVLKFNGTQWINQPDLQGSGGATLLNDLTDVGLTNLIAGQVLKYDGTTWYNATDTSSSGATNLSNLNDVDLSTPSLGQVLTFNGTEWVNAAPISVSTLDDLNDVSTVLANPGDLLTFNGTEWVPLGYPSAPGYVLTSTTGGSWQFLEYKLTQLLDVTGIGSGQTRGAYPRWDGVSEYITPNMYQPKHLSFCLSNVLDIKLHIFALTNPYGSSFIAEPIRTYTTNSPKEYVNGGMICITDVMQAYGPNMGYLFLREDNNGNFYEVSLGYDYSSYKRVGSAPDFQFDPLVDIPTVSSTLSTLEIVSWGMQISFTNTHIFAPINATELYQIATIHLSFGNVLNTADL